MNAPPSVAENNTLQRFGKQLPHIMQKNCDAPTDIIAELGTYCKLSEPLTYKFIRGIVSVDAYWHPSIFLDSRTQNALVMHFIARVYSEDYRMQIIQYILCCVMLLLSPPVSWIYGLIYWVYNGCKIPSFSLGDIAICECWDDDTSMEEIAVLKQIIQDRFGHDDD